MRPVLAEDPGHLGAISCTPGEGIATNVLADRLTRAEQDGLVVADRGTGGGRARCRPASKAPGLLPVLLEIIAWSAAHDPATAAGPAFVARLRSDRAGLERCLKDQMTGLASATTQQEP